MPEPAPAAPRWFELPDAPALGTVVAQHDALTDACATMVALDTPEGNVFPLLLLRTGPDVHAFVNRCPHFGVPLAARQEQLLQKPGISISCNVHYARFRWADGLCESGDCKGESLIAVPLEVRANGRICIASEPGGNPLRAA
jgi:nitrite reductase/ring-hydroxylating ferredoxin subunit